MREPAKHSDSIVAERSRHQYPFPGFAEQLQAGLLGRIANERIGLLERGVMRWKARKLGIQTLGRGARRFLAAERPRIRMYVAVDRDGRAGLAGLA